MNNLHLEEKLKNYVSAFNDCDAGIKNLTISNEDAYNFLKDNIPLLDCPDKNLELTYYYRWWAFRKHIKLTPEGYVITEFLPDVNWAWKYNTINMASGFHILEGRWLRNRVYTEDYIKFWLANPYETTNYTSWMFDSMYEFALASHNFSILENSLDSMIECFETWERGIQWNGFFMGKTELGIYQNIDDRDGSEYSIGGNGYRPLKNCCMYSHARTIAKVAMRCGKNEIYEKYNERAEEIRKKYISLAWNKELNFFTVISPDGKTLRDVRELHGFSPWYFNMIDDSYDAAWQYVNDKNVFWAPYGLTFCDQSHKDFQLSYTGHECKWNGPSWPLATAFTLDAMSRMLRRRKCDYVNGEDFFNLLAIYSNSHRRVDDSGKIIPWIDENINPYTGDWIARTIIKCDPDDEFYTRERGEVYNHSSFADLIIGGLLGVTPKGNGLLDILPLLSEKRWNWFSMTGIPIGNKTVSIVWDKYGTHYNNGAGYKIFCDEQEIFCTDHIKAIRNIRI